MLRNTQELKSYTTGATDGEVGRVADIFFDDQSWVVRCLVVDTGNGWTGNKVLIPRSGYQCELGRLQRHRQPDPRDGAKQPALCVVRRP